MTPNDVIAWAAAAIACAMAACLIIIVPFAVYMFWRYWPPRIDNIVDRAPDDHGND